ncbi:MAG: hypothetical protein U0350_42460 [Caldilineaceae bacterium]
MGGLIEDEIEPGSFTKPYSHFCAYQAITETEVVAVANRGAERLERFAKRFGVTNTYLDYRAMIERNDPTLSASPLPPLRAPNRLSLRQNRCAASTPKGLCASLAEADRIVAAWSEPRRL